MKKIFFYANFRTYDETVGITRKVREQINSFRKLGYDVYYSGYLKNGIAIFDNHDNIIFEKKYFFKNEKINHLLRRYLLLNFCKNFIKTTTIGFDIAYLRYHFFDSFYINLLKELKGKKIKNIIEMHSYPAFSKKDRFNIFNILDKKYSKEVKKYCDLMATMTNLKEIYSLPTFEIENTLTVDNFKIKDYLPLENKFILINIAFENKTHGLDRLLRGVSNYIKNKEGSYEIEVLLIGEYLKTTYSLVDKLELKKVVKFIGKKSKNEIDSYVDNSHFAIGSLGNHRVDSFYGSALKTKEYIARGIPFVYGWNEKVLERFSYALKLPLNDNDIEINKIIDFYKSIENKNLSEEIHKYLLKNNLSWEEQYGNLIERLMEL